MAPNLHPHMSPPRAAPPAPCQVRPWRDSDSLAELTALLHRAFAPLAAAGMNFTAASQTEAMTGQRLRHCHGLVAEQGGRIVGCVTVNGAYDPNHQTWARATPWFYRDDVAHLHQLAVDPAVQGQGVGAALQQACEQWAAGTGHRAIALDTAAPAAGLRQRYQRAGFAEVATVQWQGKAYRSVVMVKPLGISGGSGAPGQATPSDTDPAHHAATVRAFWCHVQARDWPGARALLADRATLHWPASGEHLLDADAIIRVNAVYPEGWALQILEVTPMQDGRVHSMVAVRHGAQRFLAHTLWRFDGSLIAHADETWATVQAPPDWRNAATLGAYRRDEAAP